MKIITIFYIWKCLNIMTNHDYNIWLFRRFEKYNSRDHKSNKKKKKNRI